MITEFLDQPIGGSKYFKWREALFLRKWNVVVFPESELIYLNIIDVCTVMDKIREMFNQPIEITSWYRPQEYNRFIGGAPLSAHRLGKAVDFVCSDLTPNAVRDALVHKLIDLDIRMENLPDSNWTHIDRATNSNMGLVERYFVP